MLRRSYQTLVCIFFGHKDVETKLQLGKIGTEQIQATKCTRCGRISILKSELAQRKE